jgi:hypothetical protein
MSSHRWSRRTFLAGLGVSSVLLPLLDIEPARGATPSAPKRFAALVWPDGVIPNSYFPTGGETDFTLPDVLSPFAPHRDQIIILDNIDNQPMMDQFPDYGGHASLPYLLTGGPAKHFNPGGDDGAIGNAISLDQYVANEFQKTSPTPIHSLVTGVDNKEERDSTTKYISFSGPASGDQPSAPAVQDDVHSLYKKLFGGGAGGNMSDSTLARLRTERKSILDLVGNDLSRFAVRVGTVGKSKIDAHLTSIRNIEKQLDTIGPATMLTPPKDDPSIDSYSKQQYDKISKVQVDMVVAAFAANSTRVATLLWSNGHNNSWVFYWLGQEFSQPGDGSFNPLRSQHEMAHRGMAGGDDTRRKNTLDKWFVSQFAYFAGECKKISEYGKTMLDNSVLLFANNMGEGGSHTNKRLPWIIAGSGGGYFRTGRYVRQSGGNKPLNQVLVSIAHAMDLPVKNFGPSQYGGELPGLV